MKTLRYCLLACLFAPLVSSASGPVGSKASRLEVAMETMSDAYKELGKALKAPDINQKEKYQQWAATIKDEAIVSKGLVPAKIAEMPVDQQAPVLADYKKHMDAFIASVEVLQKALADARWTDADAAMKELKADKSKGHKLFQKEE